MNDSDKFFKLFGGIFFSIGVLCAVIGLGIMIAFGEWFGGGIPLLIGLIFGAIGGGFLIAVFKKAANRKKITREGTRFSGKIYGYSEDTNVAINGSFPFNIKVRYFDRSGVEREALIPTGFTKGSGEYPIGATIDIFALGTRYSWDPNSVRFESIDREDELMDDLPLNPREVNMVAVSCPGCGASFSGAKGYVSKCPYCGGSINC